MLLIRTLFGNCMEKTIISIFILNIVFWLQKFVGTWWFLRSPFYDFFNWKNEIIYPFFLNFILSLFSHIFKHNKYFITIVKLNSYCIEFLFWLGCFQGQIQKIYIMETNFIYKFLIMKNNILNFLLYVTLEKIVYQIIIILKKIIIY